MTLFDWYSGGLNVIVIALCEVCGISWIYGMYTAIYTASQKKNVPLVFYVYNCGTSCCNVTILAVVFFCVFVRVSGVRQDVRHRHM